MKKFQIMLVVFMCTVGLLSTTAAGKTVTLWIFGDSTVKDYTNSQDACSSLLKISGWGEFVKNYLRSDSLSKVSHIITADSIIIQNKANGGRAARAFITGSDASILTAAYANMKQGDYMFVQFGHNDEASAADYPDRSTSVSDFKKFIGMYVDSTLKRGATPILITPMVRDYAWPLYNTHDNSDGSKTNQNVGNYSFAMQEVAKEKGVPCIDLTQRSIDLFNSVGENTVNYKYFRRVAAGTTLPSGCDKLDDKTHFQPTGANVLAHEIFNGLKNLYQIKVSVADTNVGTVSGISNGVKNKANTTFLQLTNYFSKGSGWYDAKYNPTVKITATPKKGYKFIGWSGDISGTTNPYSVPLTKNYNITATFVDTSSTTVAQQTMQPVFIGSTGNSSVLINAYGRQMRVTLNLERTTKVHVAIFDMQGKCIGTISRVEPAGFRTIALSGFCKSGGLYFCKIDVGDILFCKEILVP